MLRRSVLGAELSARVSRARTACPEHAQRVPCRTHGVPCHTQRVPTTHRVSRAAHSVSRAHTRCPEHTECVPRAHTACPEHTECPVCTQSVSRARSQLCPGSGRSHGDSPWFSPYARPGGRCGLRGLPGPGVRSHLHGAHMCALCDSRCALGCGSKGGTVTDTRRLSVACSYR